MTLREEKESGDQTFGRRYRNYSQRNDIYGKSLERGTNITE